MFCLQCFTNHAFSFNCKEKRRQMCWFLIKFIILILFCLLYRMEKVQQFSTKSSLEWNCLNCNWGCHHSVYISIYAALPFTYSSLLSYDRNLITMPKILLHSLGGEITSLWKPISDELYQIQAYYWCVKVNHTDCSLFKSWTYPIKAIYFPFAQHTRFTSTACMLSINHSNFVMEAEEFDDENWWS